MDTENIKAGRQVTNKVKQSLTEHLISTLQQTNIHSADQNPFLYLAWSRTLSSELLSLWLSQDRIYAAHAYPRFIGALIAKIPFSSQHGISSVAEAKNQKLLSILSYSLQNVVREAGFFLDAAKKYELDLERWEERPATKAYCAEMARVASWGSLEEGLVFLWAMEKLYLDAWTQVSQGSPTHAGKSTTSLAIKEFADNWTNAEFVKFVDRLRDIVDGLNIEPNSELWKRAEIVWDRVIELEVDFWPKVGEEHKA